MLPALAAVVGLTLAPAKAPHLAHGYEAMGWTYTNTNPDGSVNFAKAALVPRAKDGHPQIWGRSEYAEATASGVISAQGLWEFDCENAMSRVLSLSVFTEHNLRGKVKSGEYPDGQWMAVAPDTGRSVLYEMACK